MYCFFWQNWQYLNFWNKLELTYVVWVGRNWTYKNWKSQNNREIDCSTTTWNVCEMHEKRSFSASFSKIFFFCFQFVNCARFSLHRCIGFHKKHVICHYILHWQIQGGRNFILDSYYVKFKITPQHTVFSAESDDDNTKNELHRYISTW